MSGIFKSSGACTVAEPLRHGAAVSATWQRPAIGARLWRALGGALLLFVLSAPPAAAQGPCAINADCNNCAQSCQSGTCVAGNAPATTACGSPEVSACTHRDTCDGAGNCQPNNFPGAFCFDAPAGGCFLDAFCDANGVCPDSAPAPDGTSCDDGNACSSGDACQGGSCQPGANAPRGAVCNLPGEPSCVQEICDGGGNCGVNEPAETFCDLDGEPLCVRQVCDGGGNCGVNRPVGSQCENGGNQCTGVCNSNQDCVDDPVANGTTCNDGIACTQTDTCQSGACVGAPTSTTDATCDNIDDDCDGQTDEDYAPLATSCGVGACTSAGVTTCTAGVPGDTCTFVADNTFCDDGDTTSNPDDFECTGICAGGVCVRGPRPVGTPCANPAPAGVCDRADSCGSEGQCRANVIPASEVFGCRASAGVCDPAETCNGTSVNCPDDAKRTTTCRNSTSFCDPNELCDGVSNDCPAETSTAGVVCRAAAPGGCDVAETCTGSGAGAACPADAVQASTFQCRASAGACDIAESCTGSSAACPADAVQASTFECRASAGVCDVADNCTGTSNECPDSFKPTGTPCGSSKNSQCGNPDTCNGAGSCAANNESDGTSCNDGDACTGPDVCENGRCEGPIAAGYKVTGGGTLTSGYSRVSFGFNVEPRNGTAKGQLEYERHTSPKATYHSSHMTSLVITPILACTADQSRSGQQATFTGTIRRKGQPGSCDFTVVVEDCGESGRNDYFKIDITGPPACFESRSGDLDRGNIQIQKTRRCERDCDDDDDHDDHDDDDHHH